MNLRCVQDIVPSGYNNAYRLHYIMLLCFKHSSKSFLYTNTFRDFPGAAVVKNPPASAGDTGSSPGREDPTCRGATKPMRHNY